MIGQVLMEEPYKLLCESIKNCAQRKRSSLKKIKLNKVKSI